MPMKRTSPVRLTCPAGCTLAAGEGEEGGFSMLGYTGARITQFWDDFVIELSGMGADASFPILREHQAHPAHQIVLNLPILQRLQLQLHAAGQDRGQGDLMER